MNSIATIVGNIVLFSAMISIGIVILEVLWYHLPRKQADGRKRIAIITGASSGLGRAYAALADQSKEKPDEIWLIGRRMDRLEETAVSLRTPTCCLSLDLTDPSSMDVLSKKMEAENVQVSLLINCAGFGKIGSIESQSAHQQLGMIDLNDRASVQLCHLCISRMSRGDLIFNICSTAAFQPFARLAVYGASKSFFLSYTRALRQELLPRGIRVSAVCPYWIRDTEFIQIAEKQEQSTHHDIRSYPMSSKVSSVAALSWHAAHLGLPVATPGIVCTIHRIFSKLLPDTVLLYIWEVIRRI